MVSSNHINPGEKGKIKAKLDIKGRKGPVSKSIKIISNDPEKQILYLYLKALIQ